jgi:hypothetical protein
MQLQLAIFPEHTKLINSTVGFYMKDGFVYYLHNGSPIFCHSKEDRDSYRYILATLVTTKLCTCTEISKALGINVKNVQRYVKTLKEQGTSHFFNREDHRGQCYKFTEDVKEKAQELINSGNSQEKVAKELGISEGAIRYHLRNGKLKKK